MQKEMMNKENINNHQLEKTIIIRSNFENKNKIKLKSWRKIHVNLGQV